jgi:opacity protein-like surface antigen
MKTILTLVAAVLLASTPPSFAADQQAELIKQAQAAATSWVSLTDAGKYGESWERAGTFFKTGIAQNTWETGIRSLRAPLGPVKARELKSTEYATTLPGAPDGEYVVIQYETQFENKKSAVETITPMREKDGSWKVSGYFIR